MGAVEVWRRWILAVKGKSFKKASNVENLSLPWYERASVFKSKYEEANSREVLLNKT